MYRIPEGVFSRHYSLENGQTASVAYHTPSQSVVFLEDDSAEVWRRILNQKGKTSEALSYILKNGTFNENSEKEAQTLLDEFLESLISAGLVTKNGVAPAPAPRKEPNIKEAVDPTENPELEIEQFMSDQHILYSLVLELTYRCNERCVHCYLPSETNLNELSTSQIESLLEEFSSLGGFILQLTGGELLVRKDILEILAIAKKLGFVTSILSNLTLLDDRTLNAIADMHPRSVGCSIYGTSAELHDAITTIKGSFNKSIESITRLRAAGVPVIIKSPLMQSTAPCWRDIERLAHDLDCEYQFDLSITAKNDGNLLPLAQRVEDMDVLRDIFASRYYKLYMQNETMASLTRPSPDAGLCGAGASGLCISPDGTIRPCIGLSTSLGIWPKDRLSDVWRDSPFFSEFAAIRLRDIPECASCPVFSYCSRCPGAWQAEHGSFRKPTPYTCKLAHAWASAQGAINIKQKGGEINETKDQS